MSVFKTNMEGGGGICGDILDIDRYTEHKREDKKLL